MATECPLKMMKNTFYFTLKALVVLKLFIILSWLSGHVKNSLVRNIRLISKLWRPNLVKKQLQYIYWPISKKQKQSVKNFGQLLKCDIRNIFLEKSYTKWGEKNIPRHFFLKRVKTEHISGSIVPSFIQFFFIVC